jgi:hypothetical protein
MPAWQALRQFRVGLAKLDQKESLAKQFDLLGQRRFFEVVIACRQWQ